MADKYLWWYVTDWGHRKRYELCDTRRYVMDTGQRTPYFVDPLAHWLRAYGSMYGVYSSGAKPSEPAVLWGSYRLLKDAKREAERLWMKSIEKGAA